MDSFFKSKYIEWNEEKNKLLLKSRKISFEDICEAIENESVVAIYEHPDKEKYAHQYLIQVLIDDYVFLVPCVIDSEKIFLKTIFPSCKATKIYKNKYE